MNITIKLNIWQNKLKLKYKMSKRKKTMPYKVLYIF